MSSHNQKIPKKLSKIYFDFSKESEAELYDSKEHINEFFSNDANYQKLLDGELGDNLTRKYGAKLINILNEAIDLSTPIKLVRKQLDNFSKETARSI